MRKFDNYLKDLSKRSNGLKHEIQGLRRNKEHIRDFDTKTQFENRLHLKLSLEDLQKSIVITLKILDSE